MVYAQGSISRTSKTKGVMKTDYLNPSFDTAIAVSTVQQGCAYCRIYNICDRVLYLFR